MTATRVLQVISSTDRRGAEVFAVVLAGELEQTGFRVRTVALAPGEVGGLDVEVLGRGRLRPATLRALRDAARGTSVVIAHGSTTLPACAVGLIGTGVPFIYRNIGDPTFWARSWARRARVRWWLGRSVAVVAVATPVVSVLRDSFAVPADRITVIPTAASAAQFSPIDPEGRNNARVRLGLDERNLVAAVIGALSPEKDVGLAIDTADITPGCVLVVAGDGPERAALERKARRTTPTRVRFLGSMGDPALVYAAADVVLMTSLSEALPAVLIEAGLRALPVVTCDVGFVREVVIDGETGYVVSERTPEALSRGLVQAHRERRVLGAAARRRCIEHFELTDVARRWRELLIELTSRSDEA